MRIRMIQSLKITPRPRAMRPRHSARSNAARPTRPVGSLVVSRIYERDHDLSVAYLHMFCDHWLCLLRLCCSRSSGGFLPDPPAAISVDGPSLTLLKPLCGAEPGLEANLASFCNQAYPGPVQIVLGATRSGRSRRDGLAKQPHRSISPSRHRSYRRCALARRQSQDIERYQQHFARAAERSSCSPTATFVSGRPTCGSLRLPYRPRASASSPASIGACRSPGLWSRLAAAEIDHRFLPSVLVGLRLGPRQALLRLDHRAARRDAAAELGDLRRSPISWPTTTPSARPCGGWV